MVYTIQMTLARLRMNHPLESLCSERLYETEIQYSLTLHFVFSLLELKYHNIQLSNKIDLKKWQLINENKVD